MKTLFKQALVVLVLITLFNCDNDDGNAPNENVCNYQGLTAEINSTQTLIPESDLQTDYFPNNDGPGMPAVEVWSTASPGDTFIVTRSVTDGAVDANPEIRIGTVDYTGTVTCQRGNSAVGDEMRFDIVLSNGSEAELCVIIDTVTP